MRLPQQWNQRSDLFLDGAVTDLDVEDEQHPVVRGELRVLLDFVERHSGAVRAVRAGACLSHGGDELDRRLDRAATAGLLVEPGPLFNRATSVGGSSSPRIPICAEYGLP